MRTGWDRTAAACALTAVLLLSAVLASGCGTHRAPSDTPGIVGTIQSAEKLGGGEWSVLVVGGKQAPGAVSDKAVCRITRDTTIVDTSSSPLDPSELSVGDAVAVWFAGAVAESYPVQGTAAYVELR
jgi:Protein of unknown function (DUF3221)